MRKTHESSPQAEQMADESMVRNLAAQAEAIWPQEEPLFDRYALPAKPAIADIGCGTGELTGRLAKKYPQAMLQGIDLEEAHLQRARERCAPFSERVRFDQGDALQLPFESNTFDLVLSRHVLQAVPDARKAVTEMVRVAKPGGWLHMLAEDYGMLWCHPSPRDSDGFWHKYPPRYGAAVGCDLHIGRKMFALLEELGMRDIQVQYAVVDTVRVPRETFAAIWEAWRDGYTDAIAEHTRTPREEITQWWREMIACVRDPKGYALWQVPIWSARKP